MGLIRLPFSIAPSVGASLNNHLLKGGGDLFLIRQQLEFGAVLDVKILEGGEALQHILRTKRLNIRAGTNHQTFKCYGEPFSRQTHKLGAAFDGQ